MCYDDNARPPLPPGKADGAHGEDIILTATDGNRFSAYIAYPANPGAAQVVIYPDIRGLHQFYKDLALRFAEKGITALSLDYFGRTAGISSRDDSFEFRPHVQQMTIDTFYTDARAALAYLEANGRRSTFVMGFCLGGSLSFLTGTQAFDLAGVIGFYANLSRQILGADGTVLEQSIHERYPALGLFGGADQGIPVEEVHQLDENLDKSGVEHEIVIYEEAPHSFFDRRATDYAEASTDAWQRVLNFIAAHSAAA